MAGQLLGGGGRRRWSATEDTEGNVVHKLTLQVRTDSPDDGPETVKQTPGLPLYGSWWQVGNDTNIWVVYRGDVTYTPRVDDTPNVTWDCTYTFDNKPGKRCNDTRIEDPLMELPKVSVKTVKDKEIGTHNRFGGRIVNSAHEQIVGPGNEWDRARSSIRIEMNVVNNELALLEAMRNTVNASELWGLPARCIRLVEADDDTKYWGTCTRYHTRTLVFETNVKIDSATGLPTSGWDRDLLDEGTKVLSGRWNTTTGNWDLKNIAGQPPDPNNPEHFERFKDRQGENARVILNGFGRPASAITTGLGNLYISIDDGNVGNPLSDSESWVPLVSTTPVEWTFQGRYPRGTVVFYEDGGTSHYLAISSVQDTTPPPATGWLHLPLGLTAGGEYDAATSYSTGVYVSDPGTVTQVSAGRVRVEYYQESDFLLLGIPVVLL